MIRKAFKMFVRPDSHAEYQRRHNPIWKDGGRAHFPRRPQLLDLP